MGHQLFITQSCWSGLAGPLQLVLEEICEQHTVHVIVGTSEALNPSQSFLLCFFGVQDFYENENLNQMIANRKSVLIAMQKEPRTSILGDGRLIGIHFLLSNANPDTFRSLLTCILECSIADSSSLNLFARAAEGETVSIQFCDSSRKSGICLEAEIFFERQFQNQTGKIAPGLSNLPKTLADILDELLMNAFWDASPVRRQLNRSQHLIAPDSITVELFTTKDFFGISVTDTHGTFPEASVVKPITFALGIAQETALSEDTAGAGLGLMMILHKTPISLFEVNRDKSTKATVVFLLNESQKETQRKPKNVLFSFQ